MTDIDRKNSDTLIATVNTSMTGPEASTAPTATAAITEPVAMTEQKQDKQQQATTAAADQEDGEEEDELIARLQDIKLPKWPACIIRGKRVTKQQAEVMCVRLTGFGNVSVRAFFRNSRFYRLFLMTAVQLETSGASV